MTIISKEPALMLTEDEYNMVEKTSLLIEKIDQSLSDTEWGAIEHRFNYYFRDLVNDLEAILNWADESERG